MRLKDLLKEGPLSYVVKHATPNRKDRRREDAKALLTGKKQGLPSTAEKRKSRKEVKRRRKQGRGA